MPKRAKPIEFTEVDFNELILKICGSLGVKWSPDLVDVLNGVLIDERYFEFRYHKDSYQRIFVVCPKCDKNKQKLYKVKNKYACLDCQNLETIKRKKVPRTSTVWARYLRPMKKLDELMLKLADETLTVKQRQRYEKKAEVLLGIIPKSILALRARIEKDKKESDN